MPNIQGQILNCLKYKEKKDYNKISATTVPLKKDTQ